MLAAARRIPAADSSLRVGREAGRAQGSRGLGEDDRAGRTRSRGAIVARGALGMGMQVLAYDPYVSEDRMRSMNVGRAETADEVFERADFVSLHVPRTPQTMGLVNEDALAKMKSSAYHKRGPGRNRRRDRPLQRPEGWHSPVPRSTYSPRSRRRTPSLHAPQRGGDAPPRGEHRRGQGRSGGPEQVATALKGAVPVHAINAPCRWGRARSSWPSSRGCASLWEVCSTQLPDHAGDTLRIEYHGEVAGFDTRLLDVSAQKGLLAPMVFEPLNFVNTPALAKERGLKVETSRTSESTDHEPRGVAPG